MESVSSAYKRTESRPAQSPSVVIGISTSKTFLDTNSFQIHNELNDEINILEKKKQALIEETRKDKELIDKLRNIDSLEHFARENYYLKKENEEIFIIEYEEND